MPAALCNPAWDTVTEPSPRKVTGSGRCQSKRPVPLRWYLSASAGGEGAAVEKQPASTAYKSLNALVCRMSNHRRGTSSRADTRPALKRRSGRRSCGTRTLPTAAERWPGVTGWLASIPNGARQPGTGNDRAGTEGPPQHRLITETARRACSTSNAQPVGGATVQ